MNAQELVAPLAEEIRKCAEKSEAERKLPDALVARMKAAGIFSTYTPKQFGGAELPLAEALRVVQEVARHDGSAGWIAAGAFASGIFTSFLSDAGVARVLSSPAAVMAGSPGFMVRAVPVDGGYRATGQWQFASGASNADWMMTLAPIFDGPAPRPGPGGMPAMVGLFFPPKDVEIVDTWDVIGLRGTSSHDLRVDDVFVPEELSGSFSMLGIKPQRPCTMANIPFPTLLAMVQAPPVSLGIARRAIDEFAKLAAEKERPPAPKLQLQAPTQAAAAHAEALFRSAEAYFYQAVEGIWAKAVAGAEISFLERVNVRLACLTAVENSLAAVDLVYRRAGTTAVFHNSPLERCFRDVHTAAQHVQTQDGRWENSGRVLLGLPPDALFF